MGIVYLARDRRLKRQVAIKLLPPELAFRSDIKSRFLREAETAAQLACDLAGGKTPTVTTAPVNNGTADIASVLLVPIPVTADGSNGTKSVQDTVVADKFYGADTVTKICDAAVDPGLTAACTKYGVK